jgi:hypothetical protein
VTGSGQSRLTRCRVTLFEREGCVEKFSKRKSFSISSDEYAYPSDLVKKQIVKIRVLEYDGAEIDFKEMIAPL